VMGKVGWECTNLYIRGVWMVDVDALGGLHVFLSFIRVLCFSRLGGWEDMDGSDEAQEGRRRR
jgi:hypothetical protein